jgi:hypothetical protein
VRGLWKRSGWFYARFTTVDAITGQESTNRIRHKTARTIAETGTALQDLQQDQRDHNLPVHKRSSRVDDYWEKYLFCDSVKDAKRLSTLHRKKSARRNWLKHLSNIRLNEITSVHLNSFTVKRQAEGKKPRHGKPPHDCAPQCAQAGD